MKFFYNILMGVALIFGMMPIPSASAQGTFDEHKEKIETAISIINLEKREIINRNMGLNKDEESKFWTLYNEYRIAMNKVGKRKAKLIIDYADSIKSENLSDAEALRLVKEIISIERAKLSRKEEYISKFQEVLPPKKVALFYQIENKFDAEINYHLARKIPLVK